MSSYGQLGKNGPFLEKYNLPKLNQEEIDNINSEGREGGSEVNIPR